MKKTTTFLVLLTTLLLSACSNTVPFRNFIDQPIIKYSESTLTQAKVKKEIIRSAIKLGWVPVEKSDNQIVATLDIRRHRLVVLITYSDEKYSIQYQESTNLKYNGKKIHRQYVNWVTNLIRTINSNLSVVE